MNIMTAARSLLRDSYKGLTLSHIYPDRYRREARKPVRRGKVVFLEVREKALTDNFRLIRAALEKRNERAGGTLYQIFCIFLMEGMAGKAEEMENALKAAAWLADAEYIFINEVSYLLSCLPIREETTVIQTWHACGAFKKFGYSAVGSGFGAERKDLEKYPVHRNFSYVTVSAPEVVWAYAEAFHMEDRKDCILPIGVSRTDMFFRKKYRVRAIEKTAWVLRQMRPDLFGPDRRDVYVDSDKEAESPERVLPGKKIILYAPTFRGKVAKAVSPDRMDIEEMKKKLGDDYVLLIKHHPFVRDPKPVPESCSDFAFDMTKKLTIEELITVADICITDYSSIVFEYSLFERPLIFFAYDLENYLGERGFYYPMTEMMPGPVCRNGDELISVIKSAEESFDLARVRNFKYRFMSGCDGHATMRVLELMDRCREEH